MNELSLIGGVLGLNLCLLAVGYALAAPFLAGLDLRARASYAGVCLLLGAGLVGVVLSMLAYTGAQIGLTAFAAVSAALVAASTVARVALPAERLAPKRVTAEAERSFVGSLVVTVSGYCVFAISAIALVGGFRSSPWLDDSWFFWLPKGIALDRLGLDDRLFTLNPHVVSFFNLDYPLWWSIVANLDQRFVGGIDLRAINAQLTIFELAFVGAVARLLWGRVRQWVLWPSLLAILVSPELLREAQGGSADFPLAVFLALLALTAATWLATGDRFALFLAFAFAAASLALKLEAPVMTALVLVTVSAFGLRAGRRPLLALWGVSFLAFLTALPWYRWRSQHAVASISGNDITSWSYLSARTDRIARSAHSLFHHSFNPREWAIVVPLLIALTLVGLLREGRPLWLGPLTGFGLLFLFWMVAFWTAPEDRISGSVYRVVLAMILPAAVFLPVLGEEIVSRRRSRS